MSRRRRPLITFISELSTISKASTPDSGTHQVAGRTVTVRLSAGLLIGRRSPKAASTVASRARAGRSDGLRGWRQNQPPDGLLDNFAVSPRLHPIPAPSRRAQWRSRGGKPTLWRGTKGSQPAPRTAIVRLFDRVDAWSSTPLRPEPVYADRDRRSPAEATSCRPS